MCEQLATTREHVPPRCFFPEGKDTNNVNYRKDLITVPSCIKHNLFKTHLDAYLLFVITSQMNLNEIGFQQYFTKVRRAYLRDRTLYRKVFINPQPIRLGDIQTGTFEIDKNLFFAGFNNIAKGIYYHHYKKKWFDPIEIFPLSIYFIGNRIEYFEILKGIRQFYYQKRNKYEKLGENKNIFYYQMINEQENNHSYFLLSLTFYEEFNVICFPNNAINNYLDSK